MGNPDITNISEVLRWRPGPIGDPVPWWLFSQLSRETLVELSKVQLEHEKAVNVAMGNYIAGVQAVMAKAGGAQR
ncbi:MAG TPA: hypothetical protein VKF79_00205 [Candidatus Acidoferrum sp.]|nr:hypothetical protein [Candidatus Acidoferrum sp.]